ncbi:hypothetical protein ACIRYZ_43785 [Kitasatospora sp. NPDC101155]|uniref:hypothetical protein n=1 Tax=Kitasatospora sp. NPDC101155 TaxID=3364097 RepID=UPI003829D9C2
MDPMVLAAGTAMVNAMATDAWQETRHAVVAWWHRRHPEQADAVGAALTQTRTQLLTARQTRDAAGEQGLVDDWRSRLQLLLREDPVLGDELRCLIDQVLTPVPREREQAGPISMKATASGRSRVYQAGRDQHITDS